MLDAKWTTADIKLQSVMEEADGNEPNNTNFDRRFRPITFVLLADFEEY